MWLSNILTLSVPETRRAHSVETHRAHSVETRRAHSVETRRAHSVETCRAHSVETCRAHSVWYLHFYCTDTKHTNTTMCHTIKSSNTIEN